MSNFTFSLGQTVQLKESDETGTVLGRSDYQNSESCYLVRYRAADGRQCEAWWGESGICAP